MQYTRSIVLISIEYLTAIHNLVTVLLVLSIAIPGGICGAVV